MINTLKEKTLKLWDKAKYLYYMAGAMMITSPVWCLPDENTNPETLVLGIINMILTIFRLVGVVILIFGIAQVVMAFKEENPDGKSRGMLTAGAGIGLIGLKTLLVAAGIL